MKTRNDFVSNSSSCSFVVLYKKSDIDKMIKRIYNMTEYRDHNKSVMNNFIKKDSFAIMAGDSVIFDYKKERWDSTTKDGKPYDSNDQEYYQHILHMFDKYIDNPSAEFKNGEFSKWLKRNWKWIDRDNGVLERTVSIYFCPRQLVSKSEFKDYLSLSDKDLFESLKNSSKLYNDDTELDSQIESYSDRPATYNISYESALVTERFVNMGYTVLFDNTLIDKNNREKLDFLLENLKDDDSTISNIHVTTSGDGIDNDALRYDGNKKMIDMFEDGKVISSEWF